MTDLYLANFLMFKLYLFDGWKIQFRYYFFATLLTPQTNMCTYLTIKIATFKRFKSIAQKIILITIK